MTLLLEGDEVEMLEAALSFVDDVSPTQEQDTAPTTAGLGLDTELSHLLLDTMEPLSDHKHETTSRPPPVAAINGAADITYKWSWGSKTERPMQTKRRAQVNSNRARNERKHELVYLRTKVQQMETELETLRQQRDTVGLIKSNTFSSSSATGAMTAQGAPLIWRDIATRQKKKRETSERENVKLKFALESQVKLAKSMALLLEKRAKQQVTGLAEVVGASANYVSHGASFDFSAHKDTYEELLKRAETAYVEMDAVFTTNGLLGLEVPYSDARMREGGNGVYLDGVANKVLPFGFDDVSAAVWNHFRGIDKHNGMVYENATKHVEASSDTILEAFTMELGGKKMIDVFHVKQVVKRYVEADQQVIVSVCHVYSLDQTDSPFSSFGFFEKVYVVTKRLPSISPAHTILQTCSIVSPRMATGCSIDRTRAGEFIGFILSVMADDIATSQEFIENVLVDQELKHRKSVQMTHVA